MSTATDGHEMGWTLTWSDGCGVAMAGLWTQTSEAS